MHVPAVQRQISDFGVHWHRIEPNRKIFGASILTVHCYFIAGNSFVTVVAGLKHQISWKSHQFNRKAVDCVISSMLRSVKSDLSTVPELQNDFFFGLVLRAKTFFNFASSMWCDAPKVWCAGCTTSKKVVRLLRQKIRFDVSKNHT